MALRYYQQDLSDGIDEARAEGAENVLAVAPTGSGKTVLFAHRLANFNAASVAIAHRQELVVQMSLSLAREKVQHRVIAPPTLIRWIAQVHTMELGRDYYRSGAPVAVAGVDTLIRRTSELQRWSESVGLWVIDEAHHLVKDNKWGKAVEMFPNAAGLGVTATPERADGKGLGRHADGVFDAMVVGPSMRQLIDEGYLTDYRIICPPSNIDLQSVTVGKEGDYTRQKLGLATRKSSVMGDVVEHYCKWAKGKRGVTFTPDVETAVEMAAGFNAVGVPAEMICAKTLDRERREAIRKLESGALLQLVNVDLFGEGFDLPAIEVISMARATQSYGLFVQQFGRALRLLEGKDKAIILDHVGNVARHSGPPDVPRQWSLDRREKRSSGKKDPDVIPIKTCTNPVCMAPYEAIYHCCPFCGWIPTPASRTAPEFVDGDLCELDAETLAAMRGEVSKVDRPAAEVQRAMEHAGHSYMVAKGAANRHTDRQVQQNYLREAMALWMGYQKSAGWGVREAQRRFFHRYGKDVMTAQALSRADAETLTGLVCTDIMRLAKGVLR